MQIDIFQQRAANGFFGCLPGTVFPGGTAGAHHRHAHFGHHGAHISEVDVDDARAGNQLGDTLYGSQQDIVGRTKCRQQAGILAQHREQLFVGNSDQRVDMLGEFLHPLLGHPHTLGPFEGERPGHHGHRKNAQLLGDLGDDRCTAGTGTSPHAGCDEDHVGTVEQLSNPLTILHRRLTANFRIGSRTQSFGDLVA